MARAQDAPPPESATPPVLAPVEPEPEPEPEPVPVLPLPPAAPPVVEPARRAAVPVTPPRPAREAAPEWKSKLGFFGSVRWVALGAPLLGRAASPTTGEEIPLVRTSATPSLLLGLHASRITVALSPYYTSVLTDYGDETIHFRFVGIGPTFAVQIAEAAANRVSLHGFASLVYGKATLEVSYDEESDEDDATAFGGAIGALGRGFLMPMIGLEAGVALDVLGFDHDASGSSSTQIQIVGFLGLTFES